jgi:hypothetical protein
MRKRHALNCERLERRELPANSFSVAVPLTELVPAQFEALQDLASVAASDFRAVSGLGATDPLHGAGLSSHAIGAFFADHAELGRLFHTTERAEEASFESLPSSGWDDDGILGHLPQSQPGASDDEFWAFLRNYATKAIRREEQSRGPLRDHADIIQQIYVEWREEAQAGDDMHSRVLVKESPERTAFRTAVRRVLDRTRYDEAKQRRRVEASDREASADAAGRDWADLQIDLAQGVGRLSEKERDLLDLRRWGMTFEEIGVRLGMPKQRAFEAYTELLDRLTALYRD